MKLEQPLVEINISLGLLEKVRKSTTAEQGVFTGIVVDKCAWVTGAVASQDHEDINQVITEVETCLPGGVMVCGSFGVPSTEKLKPPAAFLCIFNLNIGGDGVTVTSSDDVILNQLTQEEMNKQFNTKFHCCKLRGSCKLNVELLKDDLQPTTAIKTLTSQLAFLIPSHNIILSQNNANQEESFLPGRSPPDYKQPSNKLDSYKQLMNNAVEVSIMRDLSTTDYQVGTAPFMKCKKVKNPTFTVPVSLDNMVCYVGRDATNENVMSTLQTAVKRRLRSSLTTVKTDAKEAIRSSLCIATPQHYHYLLKSWCHPVSLCYLKTKDDDQMLEYRKDLLHPRFMEPLTEPVFRRGNSLNNNIGALLINPHEQLPSQKLDADSKITTVQGLYSYHHYMQDNMNDNGWGCAYRSLQTLVSWFIHQGYTMKTVPTHREIQQILVDIGDKPKSFLGTSKWIGSIEVNNVLNQYLGVTSKILFVSRGSDLANHGRELQAHFERHGTPVMIGGGVLAHTILGVQFNEVTGDIKYLILDPHYTGSEEIKTIMNKGWCGWKTNNFWDANAYYNLCLPFRPTNVL